MKLKAGSYIGDWRLLKEIGRGGNGQVWEVEGAQSEIRAIKILTETKGIPLERFKREVGFIKSKKHPNIISIIEHHIPTSPSKYDRPWYVMPKAAPYVDVMDNKDWVDIVKDFIEIGETLRCLHNEGISHRDIKIENILYHKNRPVLADFGLVKIAGENNLTEERRDVGAKFTMAPEMRRYAHESDGCAADVYSFAKTLWVALSKESLGFDGQYIKYSSLSLSNYNSDMYLTTLDNAIESATSNSPKDRPDIQSFLDKLEEWLHLSSNWELISVKTWHDISRFIFPVGTPKSAKWSKVSDIVDVLSVFSKVKSPNYMFYPSGGGHHLRGCFYAKEDGFIELHVGEIGAVILKPEYLLFESLGEDPSWDYFRLKVCDVDYKFPEEYKNGGALNEDLVEVKPGEYKHINLWFDENANLTEGARRVTRTVSGTFLIVNTESVYNKMSGKHDANNGQYNRMSDDKFRNFILKVKMELGEYPEFNREIS